MTLITELLDRLKILPLYILPQHFLSRLVLHATRWQWPYWKNLLIGFFIRLYRIDMSTASEPEFRNYSNFNEFFTRTLRPGIRPVAKDSHSICCPVDGSISQIGRIDGTGLFQAKGCTYDLSGLLAGDRESIDCFRNGSFATLYLSPRDYHRIHMPVGGHLLKMTYVPGRLFAVNNPATRQIPNLFARNERVLNLFATEYGNMSLIMIGALFVGSMDTVWAGSVTPAKTRSIRRWDYEPDQISLDKGAELGRFNMGSSVILLFEPGKIEWLPELTAGNQVLMGQQIGRTI